MVEDACPVCGQRYSFKVNLNTSYTDTSYIDLEKYVKEEDGYIKHKTNGVLYIHIGYKN